MNLCSPGGVFVGVIFSCPKCKGYRVFLPCKGLEQAVKRMHKECPICDEKLVMEKVDQREAVSQIDC